MPSTGKLSLIVSLQRSCTFSLHCRRFPLPYRSLTSSNSPPHLLSLVLRRRRSRLRLLSCSAFRRRLTLSFPTAPVSPSVSRDCDRPFPGLPGFFYCPFPHLVILSPRSRYRVSIAVTLLSPPPPPPSSPIPRSAPAWSVSWLRLR